MKKTHGGARPNSGPKPKFKEPTKQVYFTCPESKINEFKTYANQKLNEWKIK